METQVEELEKQRCFLYTEAQLENKVGEQIARYSSLVKGVRESDDQPLKLKTLGTLICLQIQFGPQVDEQISQAIRVYCEHLGLDLEEAKETIDEIVKWFRSWIISKWPFDI